MERTIKIVKTIFFVLVRFVELIVRTYVFLIHPIIFVLVSLLLAAIKGPNSSATYEERIGDWRKCLIIDFIDWYDDIKDWVEKKLERLNIE